MEARAGVTVIVVGWQFTKNSSSFHKAYVGVHVSTIDVLTGHRRVNLCNSYMIHELWSLIFLLSTVPTYPFLITTTVPSRQSVY